MREEVICWGHEKIVASHETTLEFTKDTAVTERGDCIVGVRANRGLMDLGEEFKEKVRAGAKMRITISAGGVSDVVTAWGSPELELSHQGEIVVRKSNFVSDRTLGIRADKAAADLSLGLKEKLKDPEQEIRFVIELE